MCFLFSTPIHFSHAVIWHGVLGEAISQASWHRDIRHYLLDYSAIAAFPADPV
jgi:hypothetical protein